MVNIQIVRADEYRRWFHRLSTIDQARVADKLNLLRDVGTDLTMPHVRRLGGGLCELRVDKHRLYFVVRDDTAVVLAFGDKDTQRRDIRKARGRYP